MGINKKHPIEIKDQNTCITFLFTINVIYIHSKNFLGTTEKEKGENKNHT